jgi:hypothetical protein
MPTSLAQELDLMRRHLAEVEMELARYAEKFGPTEEAKRLLKESPLSVQVSQPIRPEKA